jgi:hypothetical protein
MNEIVKDVQELSEKFDDDFIDVMLFVHPVTYKKLGKIVEIDINPKLQSDTLKGIEIVQTPAVPQNEIVPVQKYPELSISLDPYS